MTRYRILPYRQGSKGAKALSLALGGRVLRLEGSTFSSRAGDKIINWGNTNPPANLATLHGDFMMQGWFNDPNDIRNASNKLYFFQKMQEACPGVVPRFWTRPDDIPPDAYPVVCRTVLAGHSGEGIVIAASADQLVPAPLYVQYVKKKDEYRIHVGRERDDYGPMGLTVIAQQRKARRHDAPDDEVNWQVRNHANGFVFVREGVNPPAQVVDAAKRVLEASGLDFGACDVLWNAQQQRAYVIEINTAPGLEGQTVDDYAAFFRSL